MLLGLFKNFFVKQFDLAYQKNQENILGLLEKDESAKILDTGSNDGDWTKILADKIGSKKIYGIDFFQESVTKSRLLGINAVVGDLNNKFPFQDSYFDVVHSNQVIEHVWNIDLYVSEIARVLKKGGYFIVSTENGSSWHNIFASILGWQTFSLSSFSWKKRGLGNPLALLRNDHASSRFIDQDTHKIIFNYLGLFELLKLYGFKVEGIRGAGYYPLPTSFGNIDKRHCHFMTFKARKI